MVEIIRKEKALAEEKALAKELIQNAIELGEIKLVGNKVVAGPLTVSIFERTSWKYTAAVDALKEQEQFEGTAAQTKTHSYRYVLRDSE